MLDAVNHCTLRRATAATAVLLALTSCGNSDQGEPAAATTSATPTASPTPSATTAGPSPNASSSPTVDPYAPKKMGTTFSVVDASATATVYAYRHNVAKGAPRPEEQPGYVWASIDVKVCASKTLAPPGITVSNSPWTLVYADDTQIEASSTGYIHFPEPEYPWGEKAVAPGRCVRGWITFPVPGKQRPVAVEYAPEGEPIAPRWAVK
ncbi:hypothetical protein ACIBTV_29645 [Micromonospora sp. NPDC049366]|uniref:hypothetical protein n=1 Tax=Micromonospora sp. NPDC049366 TaxID=3364271 RepID=UPI0037B06EBD